MCYYDTIKNFANKSLISHSLESKTLVKTALIQKVNTLKECGFKVTSNTI